MPVMAMIVNHKKTITAMYVIIALATLIATAIINFTKSL